MAVSAVTEPRDIGHRFTRDVGRLRCHTNTDTDRLLSQIDRLGRDVGRLRRHTDRFMCQADRLGRDVGRFARLEVAAWGGVIRVC
jgi:hypothetical protein